MVRSITFLEAGYTEQFEKIVNPVTGHWKTIRFPSTVALIEHSTAGYLLFDTGYSGRFAEVTRRFPERLYSLVTPVTVTPETSAVGRLKAMGIDEREIGHVILSHFHADHIGGAGDFSRARMVYSSRELGELLGLGKFLQVKHGFLKALLPDDLNSRSIPADHFPVPLPELGPDWSGMDLLGDSSLFLVPLPGHTLGQIGLYAPGVSGQDYLLVADAAWLTPSFEENINPMSVTDLIFHDGNEYRRTLGRIHELHCRKKAEGRLRILTCHCETALNRIREESSR